MASLTFYCDGACEPENPGGACCYGWVLRHEKAGLDIARGFGSLGAWPESTNNLAEYEAVIRALVFARDHQVKDFVVKSDSQVVIKQISGAFACNVERLQQRLGAVRLLLSGCEPGPSFLWIPRAQNEAADSLSRRAYDEWKRKRIAFFTSEIQHHRDPLLIHPTEWTHA